MSDERTCPICHTTSPPLNTKCAYCTVPIAEFAAYREAEKQTIGYHLRQAWAQLPPDEAEAERTAWRDLQARSLIGAFEATDWPEMADRIRAHRQEDISE
ncbi:hypothetical protein [Pseudactinotalea sp. Z1748]|uniref:hypothetical protein n=1 Tax=Pseudactinotalea sp. Z1748 TaxID=3413027 RepID=UPI003C7E4BEB